MVTGFSPQLRSGRGALQAVFVCFHAPFRCWGERDCRNEYNPIARSARRRPTPPARRRYAEYQSQLLYRPAPAASADINAIPASSRPPKAAPRGRLKLLAAAQGAAKGLGQATFQAALSVRGLRVTTEEGERFENWKSAEVGRSRSGFQTRSCRLADIRLTEYRGGRLIEGGSRSVR